MLVRRASEGLCPHLGGFCVDSVHRRQFASLLTLPGSAGLCCERGPGGLPDTVAPGMLGAVRPFFHAVTRQDVPWAGWRPALPVL